MSGCEDCPTCRHAAFEAEAASGLRCARCLQTFHPRLLPRASDGPYCLMCAPQTDETGAVRVASAGRAV